MAVDFSTLVYLPNYNVWARSVTFHPLVSQPGEPDYVARGIFHTQELDVAGMDGTVISNQRTLLDILEAEFDVLPMQDDRVTIPLATGSPAQGTFVITDVHTNGGGETTLSLQKVVTAKP